MTTFDKLKEIINDVCPHATPDSIKDTSDLTTDLDVDSIDRVELVLAIEEEFDIQVSDEHAYEISTVGEYVNAIDSYLKNADDSVGLFATGDIVRVVENKASKEEHFTIMEIRPVSDEHLKWVGHPQHVVLDGVPTGYAAKLMSGKLVEKVT